MSEEMRKEFENMVASGDLIPDLFSGCIMYANRVKMVADCFCDGRYHNDSLQSSFEAFNLGWKARGEAMKPIKLPDATKICWYGEYANGISNGWNNALCECREAIQQAGYKVEE